MSKIDEARAILTALGMPLKQQSDLSCYTLLALVSIRPYSSWSEATNEWIRIHDILGFVGDHYYRYKENTRESVRKDVLHHFRNAALIEDNGLATNSPNYRYRITDELLRVLQSYGTPMWEDQVGQFKLRHESLISQYASKKSIQKMPVKINDSEMMFSPGAHNALQKAIIEEFAPRFAPNSECLYVGDTTDKELHKDSERLLDLGFVITKHDKMPDVVLYREDVDWIYFIEAVTSVGPMSPKRILELKVMTRLVKSGIIFVTAFPDFQTYKKFSRELAWDTEVWISDNPDHMIHLNGDRFMGPRQ
ncbi:MAG: restriction endonuclease [Clostridia bacterium]|nr:restriction endonuclease [Clostridia bacterium]